MKKRNDAVQALAAERRVGELAGARKIGSRGHSLLAQSKLVRTWIDRTLLEQEPSVQQMAWVQYRYMTPLERTELLTKVYFDVYVDLFKQYFPGADATKKQPVNPDFVRNDLGVMNALWSARLAADALGMPYDLYLRTVMEHHIVKDGWKRPPRPNQLYGKLAGPRVRDLLTEEEVEKRMYGPEWDPRFNASEYRGDPVQYAAREMLVPLIEDSVEPAESLADYMCDRQVFPLEEAEAIFGKKLVAQAQEISINPPVSGAVDPKPYVPACLGFPDTSEGSPCAGCPVVEKCFAFTQKVRDELVAETGSDDPRRAWKKQSNKLRKRRQRANERALFEAMRKSVLDDI